MVHTDRNRVADLLKGIAVILMIQVHIIELFARQEILDNTAGKFLLFLGGPPCAPVFMAVMGYFLFSEKKTWAYYLNRGFLIFLLGIGLNIGLNAYLLYNYFRGDVAIDPFNYIFGADILPLAGISIVIIGWFRLLFKKHFYLYIIMAVLIAFLSPHIPVFADDTSWLKYLNAFLWGNFSWSYFPVFPWFAYVLTGYAFRLVWEKLRLKEKFTFSHSVVFIIPAVIALALTSAYAMSVTRNLKGAEGYYHHGLLFYGWTFLFLCAWVMAAHLVEGYASNKILPGFIRWIGKNVTLFYVLQWLIIGNLSVVLFKTLGYKNLLLWFLIIFTATALLVYIIEFVKKKLSKTILKKGG